MFFILGVLINISISPLSILPLRYEPAIVNSAVGSISFNTSLRYFSCPMISSLGILCSDSSYHFKPFICGSFKYSSIFSESLRSWIVWNPAFKSWSAFTDPTPCICIKISFGSLKFLIFSYCGQVPVWTIDWIFSIILLPIPLTLISDSGVKSVSIIDFNWSVAFVYAFALNPSPFAFL